MDYKTLNRLLSNIEKREDLLKIILKIVNLDKKIEDWFISYCHENSEAQIQSKLENDITKYVKDYKDIVRAAIKRNYLDAKSESKLMKILDTLKLLFTHNKFSESFKKNITLKMTKKDFLITSLILIIVTLIILLYVVLI